MSSTSYWLLFLTATAVRKTTEEQSARLKAADERRGRHWARLAALFDTELDSLGAADPVVMGEVADRIISEMKGV